MITPTQAGHRVSQAIAANIAATGVTRKHVYTTANMSRDSFDARMRNGEAFTLNQIIRIAGALRIPPAHLLQPVVSEEADSEGSGERARAA